MLDIIVPEGTQIPATVTFNINLNVKLDVTVRHIKPIRTPGPITLKIEGEEMDNLRVEVDSTADPDTETRVVTVDRKDGSPVETIGPYPIATPQSFLVPQNSTVTITVQDTDDSGNVSPVTSQDIMVTDTVAPAAPGQIGLAVKGEE